LFIILPEFELPFAARLTELDLELIYVLTADIGSCGSYALYDDSHDEACCTEYSDLT
jgi:hypothetical protein